VLLGIFGEIELHADIDKNKNPHKLMILGKPIYLVIGV
jgi:hypothetical protein